MLMFTGSERLTKTKIKTKQQLNFKITKKFCKINLMNAFLKFIY